MTTEIPQGLHISGRGETFKLSIGDHDLTHLLVSDRGPVIEHATPPGDKAPVYIAWVPFMFVGDIDDPEDMTRFGSTTT